MYQGSCQCGQITFAVEGLLSVGLHCHCSICRKLASAPFNTVVMVPRASFRLQQGAAQLARYNATPEYDRYHCGRCHAPIYGDTTNHPRWPFFVSAAALPDAALAELLFDSIFCASAVPWHPIAACRARYEEGPPYLAGEEVPLR